MAYWLVKSEPGTYSIDDLKREKKTCWDGVRNYQARNFLREMKKGEKVLFYHSVTEPVGVAGVATVAREAYPDPTQFDKKSNYYDAKSSLENPRWSSPDLRFENKFSEVLLLKDLRHIKSLEKMELLRKGSRLSVQPVTKKEFDAILRASK